MTHLVVPIVSIESSSIADQIQQAQRAGASLIELRVDLISDDEAVEAALLETHPLPIILTVRAPEEGGGFDATDSERIALIERLGLHLPGYVDVEFATWQRSANLRQKVGLVAETNVPAERPRNRLILSYHNFRETPDDVLLEQLIRDMSDTPAAVVKIVCRPYDATDTVRLLAVARRALLDRDAIVLALDEPGLAARVLAKPHRRFASFATLSDAAASAPGQPTLRDLQETYRWGNLTSDTRVFGVIGWPVTHSLSPAIHNAGFGAARFDGVYLPLPVQPTADALYAFLDQIDAEPALHFEGFSVTLPHKEHVFDWLQQRNARCTDRAIQCGAINTLHRIDGAWHGDNTDVAGVLYALDRAVPSEETSEPTPSPISRGPALVLGAGGAARAVMVALQERGLDVILTNRTRERAESLAAHFSTSAASIEVIDWEDRNTVEATLIVNATQVGMSPHIDDSPLETAAPALRSRPTVFDTIYNPRETRLLRDARRSLCPIITGDRMFIGQAQAQFRRWTGADAPLDVMQRVLDAQR